MIEREMRRCQRGEILGRIYKTTLSFRSLHWLILKFPINLAHYPKVLFQVSPFPLSLNKYLIYLSAGNLIKTYINLTPFFFCFFFLHIIQICLPSFKHVINNFCFFDLPIPSTPFFCHYEFLSEMVVDSVFYFLLLQAYHQRIALIFCYSFVFYYMYGHMKCLSYIMHIDNYYH